MLTRSGYAADEDNVSESPEGSRTVFREARCCHWRTIAMPLDQATKEDPMDFKQTQHSSRLMKPLQRRANVG